MNKWFLLILITSILSGNTLFAVNKIEKSIITIEDLMGQGNIKKAAKKNEKLLKQLVSSPSKENAYQYGYNDKFEKDLLDGLNKLKKKFATSSKQFLYGNLKVAQAYFSTFFL